MVLFNSLLSYLLSVVKLFIELFVVVELKIGGLGVPITPRGKVIDDTFSRRPLRDVREVISSPLFSEYVIIAFLSRVIVSFVG